MKRRQANPWDTTIQSGFQFAREMLCGDVTAAVNFDRLQKHPAMGYILFEYLLCDEKQTVTPHTSHPKWYWGRNKAKFLGLWRVARSLDATLYLVNYAKAGTLHEDKVRVIEVHDMDVDGVKEEMDCRNYEERVFGLVPQIEPSVYGRRS